MHVGDKPYVVTTTEALHEFRGPLAWGQVELSTRVLTSEALAGMLPHIMPAEQLGALDEYGATEFDVTSSAAHAERFTVIAARGGEDIWVEIRRKSRQEPLAPIVLPDAAEAPPSGAAAAAHRTHHVAESAAEESMMPDEKPVYPSTSPEDGRPAHEHAAEGGTSEAGGLLAVQDAIAAESEWGDDVMTEAELTELLRTSAERGAAEEGSAGGADIWSAGGRGPFSATGGALDHRAETAAPDESDGLAAAPDPWPLDSGGSAAGELIATPARLEVVPPADASLGQGASAAVEGDDHVHATGTEADTWMHARPAARFGAAEEAGSGAPLRFAAPEREGRVQEEESLQGRPAAVVVPLARPGRGEEAPEVRGGGAAKLQRLLRLAAGRGAGALYVVPGSAPLVRIDGEFNDLDGEPTLTAPFIEKLIAEVAPKPREGSSSAVLDWVSDVAEIGRVRCVVFRDHRGVGLVCRIASPLAISADHLGLPAEVQALGREADGLVLVGGGRRSGRSTLLASFVDLINGFRSDHVITIESQLEFLHQNRRAFISQREVRGDNDAAAATVRAALREDPDVLVIEDLRTPELAWLALEAAESGVLVFGTVQSVSTTSVIERLIEMFPAERREKAQVALSGALRGVVSQVLLRRMTGGRVAAREILLNTPAVSALIREGRVSQLPGAVDEGRRAGMLPFAESLAALVREGRVHAAHAYRKAPNREQFLAALRRDGADSALAERLG